MIKAAYDYEKKDVNIDYVHSVFENAIAYSEIVNNTLDVNTFFESIDQVLNSLLELKQYEKFKLFKGSQPSRDYKKIKHNMPKTEVAFIKRAYMEPNFFRDIEHYRKRLSCKAKNKLMWLKLTYKHQNDIPHSFNTQNISSQRDKNSDDILAMITTDVMMKFQSNFKYQLNCDIAKEENHAYIILNLNNRYVASLDILYLNSMIEENTSLSHYIPPDIGISIENICFTLPKRLYKHALPPSYLEFRPFTPTMKYSRYPVLLHFSYDNSNRDINTIRNDNVQGDIYYFQDGNIGKATITLWIRHQLFEFNFKTIGTTLVISKIRSTINSKRHGMLEDIYKV